MKKQRKRQSRFIPLPDGVEVGKHTMYYAKGWHTGILQEIKGNEAGIHLAPKYGKPNEKSRLKWVSINDLKRVDD